MKNAQAFILFPNSGIKISQPCNGNPQGVDRFIFEVKRLKNLTVFRRRDVCYKANNLFAFACENGKPDYIKITAASDWLKGKCVQNCEPVPL